MKPDLPIGLLLALALAGCSTSSSPGGQATDAAADAGDASADAGAPDGMFVISGTVVKFQSPGVGLAGATITAGSPSVTSDDGGSWALLVPEGQLFSLDFSAPSYVHATNAEESLSGNSPENIFLLVDDETATFLLHSFADFDEKLGALAVTINGESTCPNTGGATFAATPRAPGDAGAPRVLYFSNNLPDPTATSTADEAEPGAVIYNLPTGVDIVVTVKRAGCKQDPFPVVLGPGSYSGKVQTLPAETSSTSLAVSYLTVYLK
jgi:hypothetical protein